MTFAEGDQMLNHLWQSTVFAVLVGGLTLGFRKSDARVRYWMWFAASVKFLVPFSLLESAGGLLLGPWISTLFNPAATTVSPGTAILRLVDENGRPSLKLATTQQGGGLALVGESQGTYVQLSANGLTATKEGRQQLIP